MYDLEGMRGEYRGRNELPLIASYARSSAQTVNSGAGSVAIIDFATLKSDPFSRVTTGAAWRFTVPSAGYYEASALVTLDASAAWAAGDRAELRLYVNGVFTYVLDVFSIAAVPAAAIYVPIKGSVAALFAADDLIDIRVFQNSGAAQILIANQTYNYVTIKRVS